MRLKYHSAQPAQRQVLQWSITQVAKHRQEVLQIFFWRTIKDVLIESLQKYIAAKDLTLIQRFDHLGVLSELFQRPFRKYSLLPSSLNYGDQPPFIYGGLGLSQNLPQVRKHLLLVRPEKGFSRSSNKN